MALLPQPADIAREIPAMLAMAAGSMELLELEQRITARFWPEIHALRGDEGVGYLKQAYNDAVTIAIQRKLITSSGTKVFLADAGWEMAADTRARQPSAPAADAEEPPVIIDMSLAAPEIEYRFQNGLLIRGQLRPEAYEEFHGKPMTLSLRRLVDALYSAEIDGQPVNLGFGTALRTNGSGLYLLDLLSGRAHVKLVGFERRTPQGNVPAPHGRRSGRRPGATWPTIVCEVVQEHGGYADWPTIAGAVEHREESELDVAWREEVMQVLRNHTSPRGREYFEVVEADGRVVYALTDKGRKLAFRRAQDDRAPTLSKYLVKAVNPGDADGRLTNMELYTLLFLATRLGRARDARTIYHKLPENFPDEDSYAMIPFWIDQAEKTPTEDD
jgi:hypothetical protein